MKIPAFLLLLIALVLALGGCSKTNYRSVKNIKKSGVLNIFVYEAEKPFVYTEDGILQGIEVDMANNLAKRLDVAPMLASGGRADAYAAIQSGEADIAIGMFVASSVAGNIVSFTAALGSEGVFAVRRNDSGATNVDTALALRERRIAVVEGSASEYALINIAVAPENIQSYPDAVAAIMAVSAGERDVYLCGEYGAETAVASSGGVLVAEYITNADEIEFSAITARGNDELLAAANAVIEATRK